MVFNKKLNGNGYTTQRIHNMVQRSTHKEMGPHNLWHYNNVLRYAWYDMVCEDDDDLSSDSLGSKYLTLYKVN